MKLSAEQILKVEETLVLNGIKYDDIKLELTDHIASEIEDKISIDGVSFEIAFHDVFENWKEQFRPSSSLWLGRKNVQPKIVIDKWVSIHKIQSLNTLKSLLIISVILILFSRSFAIEKFSKEITIVIRGFYLIFWILIVIYRILIWKSKKITITGLMFKNSSLILIVFIFCFAFGLSPIHLFNSNSSFNLWTALTTILFFIMSVSSLQLAYKHLQFIKKLKLS